MASARKLAQHSASEYMRGRSAAARWLGGGPGAVTGIPALRPGANHAYTLDTGLVRAVAAQVAEAQDLQAHRRCVRVRA